MAGASNTRRESWGRYPSVSHRAVVPAVWRDTQPQFPDDASVLPYGLGRSYGDSCLNEDGVLLETAQLNHLIAFDDATGVLRCESGVTLAEILRVFVPRGWFLPTTPGTKFVSVGGAIANDVHGKNHHVAGTFGRHIKRFELIRSDGSRLLCSPDSNADLFSATIGGLGLTGLITWADVQLKPISGPFIDMESIRFSSLDEFLEISHDSDEHFEYTMSWIDCLATGKEMGRGLFMRGNHAWQPHIPGLNPLPRKRPGLPFELPELVLNRFTTRAFNTVLYRSQLAKVVRKVAPFDPFFYPLDSIGNWNRLYGGRGFLQHQFVVPHEDGARALRSILGMIAASGEVSLLAVIKTFGELESPGMLSFPRPGVTLALDFPFRGSSTLDLLNRLDEVVMAHGGAVYPAKDARMSPETFRRSFPRWQEFAPFIDEKFSSSFWRRVTAGGAIAEQSSVVDSITKSRIGEVQAPGGVGSVPRRQKGTNT